MVAHRLRLFWKPFYILESVKEKYITRNRLRGNLNPQVYFFILYFLETGVVVGELLQRLDCRGATSTKKNLLYLYVKKLWKDSLKKSMKKSGKHKTLEGGGVRGTEGGCPFTLNIFGCQIDTDVDTKQYLQYVFVPNSVRHQFVN